MSSKVLEVVGVDRSVRGEGAISCLHGVGNTIYLGHQSGEIIAYSVRETTAADGRISVQADFWAQTTLKGCISSLASASAIARLFVLHDSNFWLLHLHDLSEVAGKTKIRHVTCFAINQNPPNSADDDAAFSVHIALGSFGRERNGPGVVKLARIGAERIVFTREIPVPSAPLALGWDGAAVCVGTRSVYLVHDVGAGVSQELFPVGEEEGGPVVGGVEREEFVVCGLEGLGVFVAQGGVSRRAPFRWGVTGVVGVAFSFPYLVGVGEESLVVTSVLDTELRQELPLASAVAVENCDGHLFAASGRSVYKLPLVSWLSQIEALLAEDRLSEARQVAQAALKAGSVQDAAVDIFQRIDFRGVFVELETGNYDEVLSLAMNSQIDLREVMSLFPSLLPSSSSFTRQTNPALHSIPSIAAFIAKGRDEAELWSFLLQLLLRCRDSAWTLPYRSDLNTGLLKTAAFARSPELDALIQEVDGAADLTDVAVWLTAHSLHHANASLLFSLQRQRQAFVLWRDLAAGRLSDAAFPGFPALIPKLQSCSADLVLDIGRWLLAEEPGTAAKLFLHLAGRTELIGRTLEMVRERGERGLEAQYLAASLPSRGVEDRGEAETTLALLYVDLLLRPEKKGAAELAESELRARLRRLVLTASAFDQARLVSALEAGGECVSVEAAFLKGRLGDHEGALALLVSPGGDVSAAEEYVEVACEGLSRRERGPLHSALLKLLLRSGAPAGRVLALLNGGDAAVSATEVLEAVPENWTLGSLRGFLIRASTGVSARRRSAGVGRNLSAAQLEAIQLEVGRLKSSRAVVDDGEECGVCGAAFVDVEVIRYPSGVLCHPACIRHPHLCPRTQTAFLTHPPKAPS